MANGWRTRIARLTFAATVVAGMMPGGTPVAVGQESAPATASAQQSGGGAFGATPSAAQAGLTAVAGTLTVVWGDPQPGSGGTSQEIIQLTEDNGQVSRLEIDDKTAQAAGGIVGLDRERVKVVGERRAAAAQDGTPAVVRAASIVREGGGGANAEGLAGSQRFATILCRFADATGTTPQQPAYFEGLVAGTNRPQINHFWREQSGGLINIDGSATVGWVNLPQPRSYYLPNGSLSFQRSAQDCTALADAQVNFSQFAGINLMFNQELDGSAWGGAQTLTLDGTTKAWPMTWMPPWGYNNQGVLAHEMGHAFSLPHSSGPYGQVYDSRWDVMSSAGMNIAPSDPTYGYWGMGTISYHKDKLDWIPAARRYVPAPGSTQSITLDYLDQVPATAGNYLLARIPLSGSTQFFTVEARKFTGYDQKVPLEGIVIHRVDTTQREPAKVVDSTNGNPNDAGAVWLPGETFTDGASNTIIVVESATANGWQVRITAPSAPQPPANDTFPGPSIGPGVQTLASTSGAGIQSGEPTSFSCNGVGTVVGSTVWYSYTPGSAGAVTIDTNGSNFDTVLAVYTGGAANALTGLYCNDDINGATNRQSQVQFTAAAGTTYRIQAGGYAGAVGSLRMTLAGPAPGTPPSTVRANVDFNGDGRTDPAIRRLGAGPGGQALWWAPGAGFTVPFPDVAGDIPVPADYDGDGKSDVAFYRPALGLWFGQKSSNGQLGPWLVLGGQPGDVPVPCDYSGDGQADPAFFRPSTGTWFGVNAAGNQVVLNSNTAFGQFGQPGDVPVVGDYDGDLKCDVAIFRPTAGLWFGLKAANGQVVLNSTATMGAFGQTGDIAVPADYDGDGKTDVAYFRPSNGQWFGLKAVGGVALSPIIFGGNGHIPVPGYYSADNKADVAVYVPASGQIVALPTGGGALIGQGFGVVAGDAAVAKRPSLPGYPY